MIELREKDRTRICALAEQTFSPDTEIWAYGSRVKGTNHAGSDLDLVVHPAPGQDHDQSLQQLNSFIQALQDSTIPILVQVFAWDAMPEAFKKNIFANHQLLVKISADTPRPQYK